MAHETAPSAGDNVVIVAWNLADFVVRLYQLAHIDNL